MANVKITQLPLATTPLTGTEVFPLVQGTTTKQVSVTGLFTSPTMTNPRLGTVGQADLINATGLPISTGVAGLGTGVATFLGTPTSANLRAAVTDETGTGSLVFATSPTLVTPNLGTPTAMVATNITGTALGLIAGSAVTNANLTGAVTSVGNATSLGSFTSAQLATALTDETGSGANVFATSPTLVTPILGTPQSGNFSTGTFTWPTFNQNTTGTASNVTGTVAIANGGTGQITANAAFNALAPSQSGNSGKYLTTDGTNTSWATNPLGTVTSVAATVPSFLSIAGSPITTSGTLAFSLSGTALPTTSGGTGLTSFTSGGVVYASSSSALATGSALTFDGGGGLSVTSSSNVGLSLTSTSTGYSQLVLNGGSSANYIVSDDPLSFYVAASEQMRLTSTGLGIGTSLPASKLEVQESGTGSSSGVISATATSGGNAGYGFKTGGTLRWFIDTIGSAGSEALRFYSSSASSQRMLLDSSGNLGLGVTPSAWSGIKVLQVGSYGGFYNLSTAVGVSNNWYYDGTNARYINAAAASYYSQSGNVHGWYQAASGSAGAVASFTQAMTLDASGNLGLGATTTAGGRLVISQSNATQPAIYLPTDESTIQGSSANTKIDMGGNLYLYSAGVLGFVTAGTVRMTLPAAGGVKAVTTISVGNATPSSSGAGITFPATQSASSDANTLDDYEEGTWTPTDGSGAGLSITNIGSNYTKVGRLVVVTLDVVYPTTANTSAVSLAGFPFVSALVADSAGSVAYTDYVPAAPIFLQLGTSTSTLRILSAGALVTNAAVSTKRFQITVSYFAT